MTFSVVPAEEEAHVPTEPCADVQLGGASYWGGSAARIGGGFTSGDVYPAAHKIGVVVGGGTCFTVGIIGGFQPRFVPGSSFGGGPSTYGIVTSATVRTYPETPMVALILQITPQEALLAGGVQGYAGWAAWDEKSSLGPPSRMLQQAAGVFNQTLEQVQRTMEPILKKLTVFKSPGIDDSVDYLTFPDCYAYLAGLIHYDAEVGGGILMSSRLFEEKNSANVTAVRQMVEAIAGLPGQNTSAVIYMTGGGAATKELPRPKSYRSQVSTPCSAERYTAAAQKDITYHKGKAQAAFAPDTGSYLNEGNWLDPDYLTNQFGAILPTLEAAKKKYDPTDIFYCTTCVGSQHWEEEEDGYLCTVKGS
ncbi:uncharacterized protein Triagg1_8137 [Trichoderma aggressivum f. europaeum]|uniref:Uncharacterized protein n=1 Tax=Trichoderma aggressivum f. europaeum TaxID=173218 RepID=A0AAE1I8V2_9HYPO|nr:hypothetical protein Triagg1_8137 [Trichoderma aggressivum f. europaeum]